MNHPMILNRLFSQDKIIVDKCIGENYTLMVSRYTIMFGCHIGELEIHIRPLLLIFIALVA
jgi:hypothetical protein